MAENKKSFIAYCGWLETFEALPDDKAGQLAKHLFRYVNDLDPQSDDILINAVFVNIKQTLKRDLKKWEGKTEQRSEAGINSAFSKFKNRILSNIDKIDFEYEKSYCIKKKEESIKLGEDTRYWDLCIKFINDNVTKSTTVENRSTKSTVNDSDNVNVSVSVNDNEKKYKNILLSELKNSDFDNPEYFEITISFYELFKFNLIEKGASTSRIEKAKGSWIDSIRLLIENDKYKIEDLREVFEFLKVNDFWKKNILSTSKLREKFETLLMNSRSKIDKKQKDVAMQDYKQKIIDEINDVS